MSDAVRVQVSFEDLRQEEGWREGAPLGKGGINGRDGKNSSREEKREERAARERRE